MCAAWVTVFGLGVHLLLPPCLLWGQQFRAFKHCLVFQLWFVGNGDSSYGLLGMGTAVVVCWEWGQQLWFVGNGDSSCGLLGMGTAVVVGLEWGQQLWLVYDSFSFGQCVCVCAKHNTFTPHQLTCLRS